MAAPTTLTMTEIVADIIAQGGGTYTSYPNGDIVRENLTTGYMVSQFGSENIYVSDNFAQYGAEYIRDYVAANSNTLFSSDFFLRAWVDSGYVYLDVSVLYSDEGAAQYAAKANNQIAYFDNSTQTAITV